MQEERKKILEMVENGTLSSQEALLLLETLDKEEKKANQKEEDMLKELVTVVKDEQQHTGSKGHSFSSTKEKLVEFIEKAMTKIKDFDFDFQFGKHVSLSHVFHHSDIDVDNLEFDITYGNVKITPWDHGDVRIECAVKVYRTEEEQEARTTFLKYTDYSIEDGNLRFSTQFKWMKTDVTVYVPRKLMNRVKVRLFNGGFSGNSLEAKKIECKTANGKIQLDHLRIGKLEAETANGEIIVHEAKVMEIDAENINGKILLSGEFYKVDTQSLNGNIEVILKDYQTKTVHAKTVTGNVFVSVPKEATLEGELKSNLGALHLELPDVSVLENVNEMVQKQIQFSKKGLAETPTYILADAKTGSVTVQKNGE
ncbi:hypothetical protein Q73_12630 [Bacillus coahuilensis m2-6]|uniref:DUF4097 family beta strand repeat-containing protein n=1 Tax=Bacillus coahuilensis TaxID=408580 RepID=UPI000185126D|nr:DUF4097 domain-containing protein [Bacillus coahuilensis]KUP05667.1 hypothetical protein Q73_12630 [Bacillus coahuilensis m2-6]